MLVGRESERSALDALLQSARGERSAALVLRGEPGIGKTALLEYAADSARDMTVLRCVGIEAEYELPFAGMHQLVQAVPRARRSAARPPGRGAARRAGPELRRRAGPLPGLRRPAEPARRGLRRRPGAVLRRRRPVAGPAVGRGARLRRAALPGRADRAAHGRARRRCARLRRAGARRARGRRPRRAARPRPAQRPPGSPGGARRRRSPPADRPRQPARAARAALGAQRRRSSTASSRSSARRRCAAPSRPPSARAWRDLPDAARRVLLLAAADEAGDLATVQRAAERARAGALGPRRGRARGPRARRRRA